MLTRLSRSSPHPAQPPTARFLAVATVGPSGHLHVQLLDSMRGIETEVEFELPWDSSDSLDAKRHKARRVVCVYVDSVVLGNKASTTEADGR